MNFELLVATNNAHKLKEIREILSPHHITVYGMKDSFTLSEDIVVFPVGLQQMDVCRHRTLDRGSLLAAAQQQDRNQQQQRGSQRQEPRERMLWHGP